MNLLACSGTNVCSICCGALASSVRDRIERLTNGTLLKLGKDSAPVALVIEALFEAHTLNASHQRIQLALIEKVVVALEHHGALCMVYAPARKARRIAARLWLLLCATYPTACCTAVSCEAMACGITVCSSMSPALRLRCGRRGCHPVERNVPGDKIVAAAALLPCTSITLCKKSGCVSCLASTSACIPFCLDVSIQRKPTTRQRLHLPGSLDSSALYVTWSQEAIYLQRAWQWAATWPACRAPPEGKPRQ